MDGKPHMASPKTASGARVSTSQHSGGKNYSLTPITGASLKTISGGRNTLGAGSKSQGYSCKGIPHVTPKDAGNGERVVSHHGG